MVSPTNNILGPRARADGRRGDAGSAASTSTAIATISSASSPARRACSASSPRSPCAFLKKPEVARGVLLGFPTVEAGLRLRRRDHRRGHHPRWHGDDGQRLHRRRPRISSRAATRGKPASLVIVELDGTRLRSRPPDRARLGDRRDGGGRAPSRSRRRMTELKQFWQGRKNAFPAAGTMGPDYLCMDGTIPRRQARPCAEADGRTRRQAPAARRQRVPRGRRQPAPADPLRRGQGRATSSARRRSAPTSCASASRSAAVLTGEHGVGVEKRDLMGTMFNGGRPGSSSSASSARSTPSIGSTRARSSLRCTAAPNSARCTCTPAR